MKIAGKERCVCCMELLGDAHICPSCHYDQESYQPGASVLTPGTCLAGRYFLGKVLGEGGFGITYIAWDVILAIPVAVKEYYPEGLVGRDALNYGHTAVRIHEGEAKNEFENGLRSFLREARMLSQFLNLRGIVSVRDFFQENETAYIVMENIDGISIKQYIRSRGKMNGEDVLRMMEPVLHSLKQVHDAKLIHRDISADNLMMTREGELRLIDFGTARTTDTMLETITISIKRGFSPQEQYRAKGKQGPWTDIYSLCATMYYMLTGEVPEESVERMLQDSIMPLQEREDVALNEEQKAAIDRGMAVMPEKRWQDIGELYEKLYPEKPLTHMVHVPVAAREMDVAGQEKSQLPAKSRISRTLIQRELGNVLDSSNQWKVRKWKWVGGILGILLVMIAVLGVGIWLGRGGVKEPEQKEKATERLETRVEETATTKTETPVPTMSVSVEKTEEEVGETVVKNDVPDVVGLTYKRGKKVLKQSRFTCERVWVESKKDKNTVVRQSIKAGKQKEEGTHILLYVSEGAPKVVESQALPDTRGATTEAGTSSSKNTDTSRKDKKKKDDSAGSLDQYLN